MIYVNCTLNPPLSPLVKREALKPPFSIIETNKPLWGGLIEDLRYVRKHFNN